MAKFSDYLETALLNATLRGISYTAPSTVYVALYTTDPTDADVGSEVVGGGYARQPITFSAPVDGNANSNVDVVFAVATATWGTITHIGLRDAATGGNLLYHIELSSANQKTINADDQLKIGAGDLTVILD